MFNVLSFDQEKVKIIFDSKGNKLVEKKTTLEEYKNITSAHQYLAKHTSPINHHDQDNISIQTAQVVSWDCSSGILLTTFCLGENLEQTLRQSIGRARNDLIVLIRKIIDFFQSVGFLWGDFAPRNILWNNVTKELRLVDFERNLLLLSNHSCSQSLFNRYVRGYSREEFACFLSTREQEVLFQGLLEESDIYIPINQIQSKRKKSLLGYIFGHKAIYLLHEIREVEDIMVDIATPINMHDFFFFPMDSLDQISSKGGADEYAQTVMSIKDIRDGEQRYCELKKCEKNV